jgi:tRNA dimethylallyltransferase
VGGKSDGNDLMRPLIIAGPTASGKSGLALDVALRDGGVIINADALQVYSCWRVLTARPSVQDELAAQHRLFGHVSAETAYSVGTWLRETREVLAQTSARPIVVGGTGMYLSSIVNGLTEIPDIPLSIRQQGDQIRHTEGCAGFLDYLREHDQRTLASLDQNNPVRLQRAWEVHQATGRGLKDWHADPVTPLIPPGSGQLVLLDAKPEWLNDRIERRFDQMLDYGAIDECRAFMTLPAYQDLPSFRALGAAELTDYLLGKQTLEEARTKAVAATRQYAKRQRTWFRSKMLGWQTYAAQDVVAGLL